MEELSSEQVAEVLGLQVGTVRVRLKPTPRKRMKSPPKECRDLFARLSEYLDGRLPPQPASR